MMGLYDILSISTQECNYQFLIPQSTPNNRYMHVYPSRHGIPYMIGVVHVKILFGKL